MKNTESKSTRSFHDRVYACLLALYPAEHRREYSRLMMQLFRDLRREADMERAIGRKLLWWANILADLSVSCLYEHFARIKRWVMRKATLADEVFLISGWTAWNVISACIIAGGLLAKSLILSLGGTEFLAVVVSVAANIFAAFILERESRTGGAILTGAILICASHILSTVWYPNCSYWVRESPILGGFCILFVAWAAYEGGNRPVVFSLHACEIPTAPAPRDLKGHLLRYRQIYAAALLFAAIQLILPLISKGC